MEPTYEKDGENIRITTPMVRVIPYSELIAEKSAIEAEGVALDTQYDANRQNLAARLAKVVMRIQKADELGVEQPETEGEPEPSE